MTPHSALLPLLVRLTYLLLAGNLFVGCSPGAYNREPADGAGASTPASVAVGGAGGAATGSEGGGQGPAGAMTAGGGGSATPGSVASGGAAGGMAGGMAGGGASGRGADGAVGAGGAGAMTGSPIPVEGGGPGEVAQGGSGGAAGGGRNGAGTGGLSPGTGGSDGSGGLSRPDSSGAAGGQAGTAAGAAAGAGGPGAGGGTVPVDGAQYNFEDSVQGWGMSPGETPFTRVGSSGSEKFAGLASLEGAIDAHGGETYQWLVVPPSIAPGTLVTFHVFLPTGAAVDWVQPYVQEGPTSSPAYLWTGAYTSAAALVFGAWNTITVRVPAAATTPLYSLGVQVHLSAAWSGSLYLDSVSW